MSPSLPLPVQRSLAQLGRSVSAARRRRGMTQQMLAQRIEASENTVRRMEEGHPGTAIQHIARALQVFGALDKLTLLLDTPTDEVGLALMDERLPKRVRAKRSSEGGAL